MKRSSYWITPLIMLPLATIACLGSRTTTLTTQDAPTNTQLPSTAQQVASPDQQPAPQPEHHRNEVAGVSIALPAGWVTEDFDFITIAGANQAALESETCGEVFQIATGVETSIHELAVMIQHLVGHNFGVVHGPARQGDVRKNYSIVSKADAMLGWHAQCSLADGLKLTWGWFQDRQKPVAETD